jgi:uncharacterized protein
MTRAAEPSEPALSPRWEVLRRGPWLQFGSPHQFEWARLHLPIAGLHPRLAGVRLLYLTDLHLRSRWHRAYDDLVARVAVDPPDLIAIGGDIVESKFNPTSELVTAGRLLKQLPSRLGCFTILGNHDGDLIGPYLASWGVTLIDGRRATLRDGDAAIELIGGPGIMRQDIDTSGIVSLGAPEPGVLRIALSHFPDVTPRIIEAIAPHLALAGHTHGGQMCLPGGIPLLTHDRLPRRQCKGLHRIGDSWLLVGRGFGYAQLRIRTFCPAEVVEVIFEPGG